MTQPTLAQALQLLNLYNVHALRHELEQLHPAQPQAQHFNTDRTTTGAGPTDPTYQAATTPNQAATDLATYHTAIRTIHANACILAALSDKHIPTHEPPRTKLQALTNQTGTVTPCAILARIDHWSPMHVRTDFGTVFTTPLPEPVPVSEWVYRFARTYGRLPTKTEMRTHAKGGRVRVRAS